MSDEDDYGIDGIFDSLRPEQFNLTTTAIHERVCNWSDDPFETFLSNQLAALRVAYATAGGDPITAVAVLASAQIERIFAPEPDESLGDYIDRLAREATLMRARWLFIPKQTVVGSILAEEEDAAEIPVDDASNHAQSESMGMHVEAIYWYCERTDGEPRRRHGYVPISDGRLGETVDAEISQPVKAYAKILGKS